MLLKDIQPYAESLLGLFAPACHQVEIAGSIRRKKPDCSDIEIVARPKWVSGSLFGEDDGFQPDTPATDALIADLLRRRIWVYDHVTRRDGPRYKRFRFVSDFWPKDVCVDLFLVEERNWGNIFTIRTGCFEFSKWLVTERAKGGAMPLGMKHSGGYLRMGSHTIDCPTEEAFFSAIDVPWYDPDQRTPELAEKQWRRAA